MPLDEARVVLAAANVSAAVVRIPEAGAHEPRGRWRVIRARVRDGELELTAARQRELAGGVGPGVQG